SSSYEFYFCGYDDEGNLFVDGLSAPGTGHFALAELPKGGSALKTITPNQYIGWPGGVQWDGKHVAIGDQITPVIYQFSTRELRRRRLGQPRWEVGPLTSLNSLFRVKRSLRRTRYLEKWEAT